MPSSLEQQDLPDCRDARAGDYRAYIDQVDSATDEEEELLSDLDDEVFFDRFDDLRVVDEDWEIAERGSSPFRRSFLPFTSHVLFSLIWQTSPSSTIDFDNMSPYDPTTTLRTRSRRL